MIVTLYHRAIGCESNAASQLLGNLKPKFYSRSTLVASNQGFYAQARDGAFLLYVTVRRTDSVTDRAGLLVLSGGSGVRGLVARPARPLSGPRKATLGRYSGFSRLQRG